ncbi:MAG: hypothetical protein R3E13_01870 [Alphaproteobacteria bacterium]
MQKTALLYGFHEMESSPLENELSARGFLTHIHKNTMTLQQELEGCDPQKTVLIIGATDINAGMSYAGVFCGSVLPAALGMGDIEPYKSNIEIVSEAVKAYSPRSALQTAFKLGIPAVFSTFQDEEGFTLQKAQEANPNAIDATYPYEKIGHPEVVENVATAAINAL